MSLTIPHLFTHFLPVCLLPKMFIMGCHFSRGGLGDHCATIVVLPSLPVGWKMKQCSACLGFLLLSLYIFCCAFSHKTAVSPTFLITVRLLQLALGDCWGNKYSFIYSTKRTSTWRRNGRMVFLTKGSHMFSKGSSLGLCLILVWTMVLGGVCLQ